MNSHTRSSAVDSIVASIRGMIASDGLVVGDSLPTERELCQRFGSSRNTVREAMGLLKAYGLVEVRPKVGATIIDNRMARAFELFSFDFPHISRETFADVQGFRVLLEVAAADHLLERATETDVADLREINARLLTARSITEAAGVDFEMHLRLVSIFDNRAILDVYRMMKPVILRIMAIRKTRRTFGTLTYSEHEAVIDALAARDRIAYQYRLQTHLEFGFAHFDEATETEP